MRQGSFARIALLALLASVAACGGDEPTVPQLPEGTLDLTFTGDDTFQGAHGGQTIHVGVVHQGTSTLVASDEGTVSSGSAPTFAFTFAGILAEGESYHLDYWIDSNFNGGTQGACDPPATDHQWRIDVGPVTDDVTIADTHRPAETEDVCGSTDDGTGDPGY